MSEPSDALSALAPFFRVQPELQTLCRFADAWQAPHPPTGDGWAPFHMVTAGACVLDIDVGSRLSLGAGDIVLLPHGDAHVMRGTSWAPGTPCAPLRVRTTAAIEIKSNCEQPEAELICGRLRFERALDNFALAALPKVIHVETAGDGNRARLGSLLTAIREELDAAAPGARAISTDLASALLVMVLRAHFQRHALEAGPLRLLSQRQTARALLAMIADPARPWSLDDIAAAARTSRATLVRDFRRLAAATPFDVLADLRLGLARHSLGTTDRPLADIAVESGYASPSAFSRAFQRRFGHPPGEVRQARDWFEQSRPGVGRPAQR